MLKKEARLLYTKKRAELSDWEVEQLSDKIYTIALPVLNSLPIKHLNCFLSSVVKKEVNTNRFLQFCLKKNIQVSVPDSNYKTHEIKAIQYTKTSQTSLDKFGIPEITPKTALNPKTIDVVLIPLLAFDKKGYRIGYGKGMYDRFLQECSPNVIKIGLSFFEALNEISDLHHLDVPLDIVITPTGVLQFEN